MYGLLQSEQNAVAARKRPLSAMTPTIALKNGKLWFACGSPGGPTIINTLLQTLINVIDHGMTMQEAVDAPRIHHQWMPDEIAYEVGGIVADVKDKLQWMGHKFAEKPRTTMGDCEAIMIEDKTGVRLGASDPRRGGQAIGY
jgi:gamma-glutamyltranspeptidase/glutathione hydrolase